MKTISCNSNQSSYPTRIKNITFVKQARRHVVKSGQAEVRARAKGTSKGESTRWCSPLLVRGVRGISPENFFDLWLPLCAILMHFEQAAMTYPWNYRYHLRTKKSHACKLKTFYTYFAV